ncbi:hypothetical protein M758_4G246300 [Ceratodon purpureus]|nr:hypothetical protein M758_4G246300 [Ceratodon purpureus]KAG0620811.1 hypothetical protein M758_4G246300 [Ceratodon purpureus]KAG0620812.1 hypothetical protein M758_4G246300 [Ceratodon purpureus]
MDSRRFSVILLLLLAGVLMFGSEHAKAEKKVVAAARKEDIPFIKCSVCEAIAKQLARQVKEKRQNSATKKISEFEIIDVAENICNLKKEEGDWILKLDIVEKGDKLQLVEQSEEGVCKTECKTIERACQEVMGDHDTDVAEYLYKPEATRAGVIKLLCKDLSKACVGKPPRLPKDRAPGEPFTPKAGKEAEMDKLMRSLNDVPGAPEMKMYSREELIKNPGLMDGGAPRDPDADEDDEDDDDEDEDDVKTSQEKTLVKTWRDSVAKVGNDVRTRTHRMIQTASKSIEKARRAITSWWYGKKPTKKSSSKSSGRRKSSSDSSSGEL